MAWEADQLGRASTSKFLTDYLSGFYGMDENSHFVLALDSAWGKGKTFFLKNWEDELKGQGYQVVYFNAWENDFSEDPLVSLISELYSALAPLYKKIPKAAEFALDVRKYGVRASKLTLKVLLNLLLKKLSGESIDGIRAYLDEDGDTGTDEEQQGEKQQDAASAGGDKRALDKAIDDLTKAAFKEHASKKHAIENFNKSLASLLNAIRSDAKEIKFPLFIFIDELDRCRPNYAVELLEAVKHLFGVPGVYFVIATHVEQLAASINVLYGDKFDSRQYLKRFFNQEYVLPSPEPITFIQYLYRQYQPFASLAPDRVFMLFENTKQERALEQEVETFLCLAKAFDLSLRDMEQAMMILKAICLTWEKKRQLHLFYMLFWIILKNKKASLFEHIKSTEKDDAMTVLSRNMLSKPGIVLEDGKTVSAFTIINHYYDRRNWNLAQHRSAISGRPCNSYQLPDAIDIAFDRETAKVGLHNSDDYFVFNRYPQLVEQAGQLN